jgi:hypothetical protein
MPVLFLAAIAAQAFAAGTPAFDPRLHKTEVAGNPARVLVLGSPHLSQLPTKLDSKLLDPLLDRLAAFKPEVITVEGLSGEECDTLAHFKAQHGTAWDDYCWPTDDLQKATGLSVPAAAAEVDKALADWPKAPTAAQRRHLAMLFLGAGDRGSATVQWLRLPAEERHVGDGLDPAMVDIIERKGKAPNEIYALGSALAARLGLERIYLVDDHTADTAFDETSPEGRAYANALQSVWRAKPEPVARTKSKQLEAHLDTPGKVIGFYRFLNDPKTQRETIASDMGAAARSPSAQPYGREYLSWWETRNLRMVANIRAAFAGKPDARVLSIVGNTHKGYFDAYLDMMQDVRLVDAEQFLK